MEIVDLFIGTWKDIWFPSLKLYSVYHPSEKGHRVVALSQLFSGLIVVNLQYRMIWEFKYDKNTSQWWMNSIFSEWIDWKISSIIIIRSPIVGARFSLHLLYKYLNDDWAPARYYSRYASVWRETPCKGDGKQYPLRGDLEHQGIPRVRWLFLWRWRYCKVFFLLRSYKCGSSIIEEISSRKI